MTESPGGGTSDSAPPGVEEVDRGSGKRRRIVFVAFVLTWSMLMAFVAQLLVTIEIRRWESGLETYARGVVAGLRNRLDANEAVLAGFSAFLQTVDESDLEAVTRYAAAVSAAYPHIYMMEVARRVPLSDRVAFEATLRKRWRPDFAIRNFSELTGQPAKRQMFLGETWPILFMYPALSEAAPLYGIALETVDYLSHTLALARKSSRPVVSPVFTMYEGASAFILLQEVNRQQKYANPAQAAFFGDSMTALLLIRTSQLSALAEGGSAAGQIQVLATMHSAAESEGRVFEMRVEKAGGLERIVLPRLALRIDVGNATQPIRLDFEQQLRFSDVLTPTTMIVMALFLGILVGVPVLAFRHFGAQEHAALAHRQSAYLATHDALSQLPNRYLFADRFERARSLWQRNGSLLAVLLVDLDDFKQINERFGHAVGDHVLRTCARRLIAGLRACDTVARQGGDEFIVLLEVVSAVDDACLIAEKIRAGIAVPIETSAGEVAITCSVGVAVCPAHGTSFDALHRAADQAMYAAKRQGRNQVSAFQHLHVV